MTAWLFRPIGGLDMLVWCVILTTAVSVGVKFTRGRFVRGVVIGLLIWAMPIISAGVILLIVGAMALVSDNDGYYLPASAANYRYYWFGRFADKSGLHNGWRTKWGSSTWDGLHRIRELPPAAIEAMNKAVNIDPYNVYRDGVVFSTHVYCKNGKWLIEDSVCLDEQIVRRAERGVWDEPQAYKPAGGYVSDSGWVESTDELPAPAGLAAQFMSQFNGPKLTTRIRPQ